MRKNASSPASAAFTIIELLSVIAIIGVLAAILIPIVGNIRQKSWTATSTSNLRQLGQATALYVVENSGKLPMEATNSSFSNPPWYIALSSYISITRRSSTSNGYVEEDASTVLLNPATSTELPVNFAPSLSCGTSGSNGVLTAREVEDPVNKVWLTTSTGAYYYNPYNLMYIEYPHNNHANMLFFDGHVELVEQAVVADMGRDLVDPRLN
tara:strand:- start:10189 stop:10821 length:633 start_codon:yes stop_codon:yes gene_type:complete